MRLGLLFAVVFDFFAMKIESQLKLDLSEPMIYGYARVSTVEQDTQLQLHALTSAGAVQIYSEKTSSVGARPQLHKLLVAVKQGDLVLVYKLDRLARSLKDLLHILEVLERKGVRFRSLTEPVETDSYLGKFLLQILGAVAELERNLIRERSIAGQQVAMRQGKHCGKRPGYTEAQYQQVLLMVEKGLPGRFIAATLGLSESQVKRIRHGYNKSYKNHKKTVLFSAASVVTKRRR